MQGSVQRYVKNMVDDSLNSTLVFIGKMSILGVKM